MAAAPDHDLAALRARIDELDRRLIDVVAERLAVCREIARLKEGAGSDVIQPARVRDVVVTRRQLAIEAGLDPDFVEQLVRVLLTETHRIEVAGRRVDAAPDKTAAAVERPSDLDTVASRIDHVVVAVPDLDAARASLVHRFGFHDVPLAHTTGATRGVAALEVGGVTVVLVGAEASPAVAGYLERHGAGVQHLALEVLDARFARACLDGTGAALLTEVVIDADGHEQFFAVADPSTGVQLGFISRTGHRVGIGAANVLALFDAMEPSSLE